MQVQSIKQGEYRQNFQAKVNFVVEKYCLPKNGLKRLSAKAKTVGTDADTFHIGVYPEYETEPAERNLFHMLLGIYPIRIKEVKTRVILSHVFPSENRVDMSSPKIITGTAKEQRIQAYKTVWKYIDSLKDKIEGKKSL